MIGKGQTVRKKNINGTYRQKGFLLTMLFVSALLLLFFAAPQVLTAYSELNSIVVNRQPAASPLGVMAPQAPQAVTTTITLRVESARTEPLAFDGTGVVKGDQATQYKFIINVDNAGDPFDTTHCFAYTDPPTNTIRDPLYPDECDWPGVHTVAGWAPVYTQGNQDDLNETAGINLPPGRYLISVMADGYKVDGEHFTVPLEEPGLVTVAAQPMPLPTAQMVIKVFDDSASTNGQYDAPVEDGNGLEGFRATIADIAGEITTDLYGNPLCSDYKKDDNGNYVFDGGGLPIVIPGSGGECLSDANGDITIPFIGSIRY